MEVLGIGPLEFLFIFIIILLVLGPKDIEKTARNLGKGLNRIYKSPNYQVIRKASEEIRNLPSRLAAEAQLDELKEMAEFKEIEKDLNEAVKTINAGANDPMKAWIEEKQAADSVPLTGGNGQPTPPARPAVTPPPEPENSMAPPSVGQPPATPIANNAPAADPTAPASTEGAKS